MNGKTKSIDKSKSVIEKIRGFSIRNLSSAWLPVHRLRLGFLDPIKISAVMHFTKRNEVRNGLQNIISTTVKAESSFSISRLLNPVNYVLFVVDSIKFYPVALLSRFGGSKVANILSDTIDAITMLATLPLRVIGGLTNRVTDSIEKAYSAPSRANSTEHNEISANHDGGYVIDEYPKGGDSFTKKTTYTPDGPISRQVSTATSASTVQRSPIVPVAPRAQTSSAVSSVASRREAPASVPASLTSRSTVRVQTAPKTSSFLKAASAGLSQFGSALVASCGLFAYDSPQRNKVGDTGDTIRIRHTR